MARKNKKRNLVQVVACGDNKVVVAGVLGIRCVDLLNRRILTAIDVKAHCVAWNPVSRNVAVASNAGVALWNLDSGKLLATMPHGPKRSKWSSVDISPDGNVVIACNGTYKMWMWSLDSDRVFADAFQCGDEIGEYGASNRWLRGLKQSRFSYAGSQIIAIGGEGGLGIRVTASKDQRMLSEFGVRDFSEIINGHMQITGFACGEGWLAYRGSYVRGRHKDVPSVEWSKEYFLMAAPLDDPIAGFWSFEEHPVRVTALDAHAETRWIVAAGEDGRLRMSRFPTKEDIRKKRSDSVGPIVEIGFPAVSVSFSPDGAQLAVVGSGGEMQLWGVSVVGGASQALRLDKMYEDNSIIVTGS